MLHKDLNVNVFLCLLILLFLTGCQSSPKQEIKVVEKVVYIKPEVHPLLKPCPIVYIEKDVVDVRDIIKWGIQQHNQLILCNRNIDRVRRYYESFNKEK